MFSAPAKTRRRRSAFELHPSAARKHYNKSRKVRSEVGGQFGSPSYTTYNFHSSTSLRTPQMPIRYTESSGPSGQTSICTPVWLDQSPRGWRLYPGARWQTFISPWLSRSPALAPPARAAGWGCWGIAGPGRRLPEAAQSLALEQGSPAARSCPASAHILVLHPVHLVALPAMIAARYGLLAKAVSSCEDAWLSKEGPCQAWDVAQLQRLNHQVSMPAPAVG